MLDDERAKDFQFYGGQEVKLKFVINPLVLQ